MQARDAFVGKEQAAAKERTTDIQTQTQRYILKMQGFPGAVDSLSPSRLKALVPSTLFNELSSIWDNEDAQEEISPSDSWEDAEEHCQAGLQDALEDDNDQHLVESILDRRVTTASLVADPEDGVNNGKDSFMYLVKWQGFADIHNSWEPRAHLIDTAMVLRAGEAPCQPCVVLFGQAFALCRLQIWQ
jgi:hypothetical protein